MPRRRHGPFADAPVAPPSADRLDVVTLVRDLLAGGRRDVYRLVLAEVERVILAEALRHTGGNQVQASDLLGISRTTLRANLHAGGLGAG